MLKDARYGWRGDVLTNLATKEEVIQLYKQVEGKAISVTSGGRISVEILPQIALMAEVRSMGLREGADL